MPEDSREVTGGLQEGVRSDPYWEGAESPPLETKNKGRKNQRKRKASKSAAGRTSVKELLDNQGVTAQKQTDPEFTGFCPHCNETGQEGEAYVTQRHALPDSCRTYSYFV